MQTCGSQTAQENDTEIPGIPFCAGPDDDSFLTTHKGNYNLLKHN